MAFRDVVGHQRVLGLLSRSIAAGQLPPSLIFSGPAGVGKSRTALAVAQALNCTAAVAALSGARRDAPAFDACGECAACRRILRGSHPDVLAIQPGENGSIKIEQVRDAIDRSMYRPFEGRRRVTIIDDADALVAAAQNALLKTLEEPPSSSCFILVTSRPDALLATVTSRCSEIRFSRLAAGDVAAVLEAGHGYSRREAAAVAAAADGSVGRALEARADEFADARGDAQELLRTSGSRGDARGRLERAKMLVRGGGAAASEREYLGLRIQALASLARDVGILASGADDVLLANADLRADLEALARTLDGRRALAVYGAAARAQDALDRNVSPKVVADWLALQV